MVSEGEAREWNQAKQVHYDRHSRHFPITECNVKECMDAVRTNKKNQERPTSA